MSCTVTNRIWHRTWAVRTVTVLTVLFGALTAGANTCRDPIWIRRIVSGIDTADPDTLFAARRWVSRWMDLEDERVARGMLRTLLSSDLKAIGVTFKTLRTGDVPFPAGSYEQQIDEMYRVIGELTGTDPDLTPMEGLVHHISNIMSDNRPNQLGALLDLRVADDVGLAQGLGTPHVGFEITESAPSPLNPSETVSRQMDVVDLNDFAHESKNWPNGLPIDENGNVSESILRNFEEEFRRDIVIFGNSPNPFERYRLNFRETTRAHLDYLKARLDAQFTSSFVTSRIESTELARIRAAFDDLWALQDAGDLMRFYP